ncbi:MAG: hypothetical protein JNK30_07170 [Phenylobacterium sp.]|uniref:hypothetical protein n=1 Tax=Phenylobacterium sp. TaxID=1871053 RepID=UPI001A5B40EF|nr:hypothetical protein [Phenylobacterium sp.]MBL8771149.1 hypothetical protein [Phenylobacterium sp.]
MADYAAERAARTEPDASELDAALAEGASDEMLAALAAAPDLQGEALPGATRPLSPLQAQWERFRDRFAEAMAGGLYTIEDLEAMIAGGEAYLWPGADAAIVTQVVAYPSGEKVLQTLWAVGDLKEVLALEPALCASARLLGCSRILIEGRKGWERLLKPAGYEPWSVTVSKVV